MTKNEVVDTEVVKAIKKSAEKFKQLYPILEDAHGEIIDGEHRRVALNSPDTRRLDYITTKKERLEARLVANHARRGQNKKTWEFTLNDLATILERDGVEKIGRRISEETGLPYRTIMRYLPLKFKDQAQSKRASHPRLPLGTPKIKEKTGTSAQSLVSPPAKRIPENIISESEIGLGTGSSPYQGDLKIMEEFEAKEAEKPRIKIQRFSNQSWRAIIVPKAYFEKIEKACAKRNIDTEEAITLALMKLLHDLRSKSKCLPKRS